jgi:mannose-6-phosphate isomerase-like protein (cupin superfamily)
MRQVKSKPYSEKRMGNLIVREFSSGAHSSELEWHKDHNDRHLRVVSGSGWKLQRKDGLPVQMKEGVTYYVPKNSWHRIIKGEDNLKIAIVESTYGVKKQTFQNRLYEHISNNLEKMRRGGASIKQQDAYVTKVLIAAEAGTLNEGLMDMIKSASNGGLLQGIQKQVGLKIADFLGLPENTMMRNVVVNVIENMDMQTLTSMFQRKNCQVIAQKFSGTILESIIELITQHSGLDKNNVVLASVIEGLQKTFVEKNPLVDSIAKMLCSLSISSFFGGGKKAAAPETPATPTAPAAQAPAAAPAPAAPATAAPATQQNENRKKVIRKRR